MHDYHNWIKRSTYLYEYCAIIFNKMGQIKIKIYVGSYGA